MGVKLVWALIEGRDTEIMSAVGYVLFMESLVPYVLLYCCLSVAVTLSRQLLYSKGILLPTCLNQKDLTRMGQGFSSFFLL